MEWTQLSPNEMREKASTEKHTIEAKVGAYVEHIANEGKHVCTQEAAYTAIQSFFKHHRPGKN